jgi:hypothetical protein
MAHAYATLAGVVRAVMSRHRNFSAIMAMVDLNVSCVLRTRTRDRALCRATLTLTAAETDGIIVLFVCHR